MTTTTRDRRQLSLFDATMLVMGGILGIGIFFNPATVAREVPTEGAYLLMWGLGAVAALSGAMTFAELSAAYPRTGGWYVFLREAFGRLPAFLFAWVVLLVVSTGACALVARFFAAQVATLTGAGSSVEVAIAGTVVLAVTGVGLAGIKSGALFQNLCMLLKIGAIGTFIVTGLALFGGPPEMPVVEAADRTSEGLVDGMLGASLAVLFSYGGWQLLSYIAPSVENPERNLPRAIVIGVSGVAVIYLLVNLAYVRVLGMGGLASQSGDAMAVRMAELAIGSSAGATFVTAAMAVSALGFLVATLITTPGIYVAMAREGLFLESFGRLHPSTGAPVLALLTQAALVLAYLAWSVIDRSHVDTLTGAVVFAEWIFHGLAGLALISIGRRAGAERPFRSPFFPLFPVTYTAIAVAVVLGNLVATRPAVTMLGLGVLAVGAVAYVPWTRAAR
ncbi:MAG: amino acid permease [Planctomycetota bacterium]